MDKKIETVIHNYILFVASKGLGYQEMLDLLITLLFGIYASAQQEGGNSIWQDLIKDEHFLPVPFEYNVSKTQNKPEQYTSEITDLFLVDKPFLQKIGKIGFNTILSDLMFFSFENWRWSKENILLLFNTVEFIFASNMKSAHFLFTPAEVAKLMALTYSKKSTNLYDPYCRTGELLAESIAANEKIVSVKGMTPNSFSLKIAVAKSIMLGFPRPDLTRQTIFETHEKEKFDFIITNPPFGGKTERPYSQNLASWQGLFGGQRQELDFLCYVLDHLLDKGHAAVIVPVGLLSSSGKIQEFRKRLIQKNMLEAVISLPQKIFYDTQIMTAILLINGSKKNETVLLVDVTEVGIRQKDIHKFSDNDVNEIVSLIHLYQQGIPFSKSKLNPLSIEVTPGDFENHEFDLQHSTYKTKKIDYSSKRRPSNVIWKEIIALKEEFEHIQDEISKSVK